MTSINFTPDEIYAIFFAASKLVTEAAFAAAPDLDTALLWIDIQHKTLIAMCNNPEDELANLITAAPELLEGRAALLSCDERAMADAAIAKAEGQP